MTRSSYRSSHRSWTHSGLLAGLLLAGSAFAINDADARQAVAPEVKTEQGVKASSDSDLLKDFIHFTRIARYDVAASVGRELLSRNPSPRDFVKLVDSTGEGARFDETVGRAMRVAGLEPLAGAMYKMYETGRLEAARDPNEIAENIGKLTGTVQGRIRASSRLKAAGEYAVPQLLTALMDRDNSALRSEAQRVLVDIGSQAVIPLSTAMVGADPAMQERLADVLGLIGHRSALPFLADVRMSSGNQNVRTASERAITRIDSGAQGASVAELYIQLANRYYNQSRDVTSFPGEEYQLLWSFQPAAGLTMTGIRSSVFHEAMAMRLAERALEIDASSQEALTIWLASNLRREIQQPQGYDNPAYPSDRRDAMYFAVTAGAGPMQGVLARAIDAKDTLLARKSIAAIEQTAGSKALVAAASYGSAGTARQPLVEALSYPNRRVQYESALAIGSSQPGAGFAGSDRVVPTMAAAVRDAASKFAAILARDAEQYQAIRKILEGDGYVVLSRGSSMAELEGPIAEVPAVDLIVAIDPNPAEFAQLITTIRGTSRTAATPILALTIAEAYPDLRRRYETETIVAIRPIAIPADAVSKSASDLVLAASGGPIGTDEATAYAARSLRTLRDLALTRNAILPVEESVLPLIKSLADTTGSTRQDVAEVLALVPQQRAQVALMDAAIGSSGAERVMLINKVATSAKRFGNQLEERQVRRVLELARSSDAAESTAAAALAGSLNLPNADLLPLILGGAATASK
ncbi:MAG: HEAT repeat domain-containing protein [Phycisphaerales bacterium]|nr:HEAT repeat domain-containing protein [Phycisphaerales bacterium]